MLVATLSVRPLLVVAVWIVAVATVVFFFCVGVWPIGSTSVPMLPLMVLGAHGEDLGCRLEIST